jgi:uncharacterized protein
VILLAAAAAAAVPPAPDRWVTDQVGMLSPGTRAALDRRLESYQARTGHQVIVWIGTSLGGDSLETWAANTFAAWGIGRQGKDDGVAIFILAQDRRMRIEVGYGLEERLTDLASARIIRERMTPLLRQGNPDGAVTAAVSGVLETLGGEDPAAAAETPPPPVQRSVSRWELIGMAALGLLFLVFLVTHPRAAIMLLFTLGSGGRQGGWGGGRAGGGGGFSGGGGRSGGGGASGSW